MVSKISEVNIQTEEKPWHLRTNLAGHTKQRTRRWQQDQNSVKRRELGHIKSERYNDFEDDQDLHSTSAGDLQSPFATKNDIKRFETQQEVMLVNQILII